MIPAPRFQPGETVRLVYGLGGGLAVIKDQYRPGLWRVELVDGVDVVISDHGLRRRNSRPDADNTLGCRCPGRCGH